MIEQYIPILLMLLFAAGLAAILITISYLVGPKSYDKIKLSAYECGINPIGDARDKFSVKYYLVAALFILFDVEAVFLFAWAVVYKDIGLLAFIEILIFFVVIIAGFFYVVKRGALEWE